MPGLYSLVFFFYLYLSCLHCAESCYIALLLWLPLSVRSSRAVRFGLSVLQWTIRAATFAAVRYHICRFYVRLPAVRWTVWLQFAALRDTAGAHRTCRDGDLPRTPASRAAVPACTHISHYIISISPLLYLRSLAGRLLVTAALPRRC